MKGFVADCWRITVLRNLVALLIFTLNGYAEVHLSSNESYTQEQAREYCQMLGPQWRMMSIQELFALPNTTPFRDNYSYWSGTTIVSGDAVIGTGSEGDGGVIERVGYSFFAKERNITLSPLTKKIATACTNAPTPKMMRQYQSDKQGTKDKESGLLWHGLDATDKKAKYTYEQATEMCDNLTLEGRTWRLPTLSELYGIVDIGYLRPSVDMSHFGPMMHRYYWTSDVLNDKEAYVVGFKLGSVATVSKKESAYARCVSE